MADGLVTLVEATAYDPSVTNKLIRSEELDNAGWGKSGATVTANATLAPDGTATADTIVETATNAFHVVSQYVSGITAGVPVMASGHLKAAGRSRLRIQTDTSPNNGTADFDLATGTIFGTTGIASAPRLIPLGNGWWRFAVLWTPTSSVALGIKLILAAGSFGIAYTGDGVSGMHAWLCPWRWPSAARVNAQPQNMMTAISTSSSFADFRPAPAAVQWLLQRTPSPPAIQRPVANSPRMPPPMPSWPLPMPRPGRAAWRRNWPRHPRQWRRQRADGPAAPGLS